MVTPSASQAARPAKGTASSPAATCARWPATPPAARPGSRCGIGGDNPTFIKTTLEH